MDVPYTGAQQARTFVDALATSRPSEGNSWTLAPGHDLYSAVQPLCARIDDRLIPVGSAFMIGHPGIMASAYHVVHDALQHHPNGDRLRQEPWPRDGSRLDPLGLSLLHRHTSGPDRQTLLVWPLETMHGAPPSDLLFGFATLQGTSPFIAMPLSFNVPRVGSRVSVLGYGAMRTGSEGLSRERIETGDPSQLLAAGLDLQVYEGRITHIFAQRFLSGYIGGPNVILDVEFPHGVSGGPALNEQGFVVGVASAGASTYFDRPASIVSLLNPTLFSEIEYVRAVGSVRLRRKDSLCELVCRGEVTTDGSEEEVPIGLSDEGPIVHMDIDPADWPFTHDDLHGYEAQRPATHPTGRIARVRRATEP